MATNVEPKWFVKRDYLESKLAQLQSVGDTRFTNISQVEDAILAAGMTVYGHYAKFSLTERTSPNEWFNATEYLQAKAKQLGGTWTADRVAQEIKDAGFATIFDHFAKFGWTEGTQGVNPSNKFDVSEYLRVKADQANMSVTALVDKLKSLGMDPVTHYMLYGKNEAGVVVTAVSGAERVGTSYTLSAAASANEGAAATFTLTTTGVADGTVVPYTLTGVATGDVVGGQLTGNAIVNGGTATITIGLRNDNLTEGAETLVLALDGKNVSKAITVNDTSIQVAVGAVSDANNAANTVAENGTLVGITASATDANSNDTVTYSLTTNPGNLFAIDAATGVVTVNGQLDYETAVSHNITVKATSTDGTSSTKEFTIAVTNVDDNAVSAVTDVNLASNSVVEGVAGPVGITASATDADALAIITYTLVNGDGSDYSGPFSINPFTGVVSVDATLDHEAATSQQIYVKATSGNTSSTQVFTIDVLNANDNVLSDVSDADTGGNTVREDAAIGSVVGVTARATDLDRGAVVTYELLDNAGGRFAIDPATGVITVAAALDFETATSHTITVQANSAGETSTQKSFTIAVEDVSDSVSTVLTVGTDTPPQGGLGSDVYDGRTNANSLNTDDVINGGTQQAGGADTVTANYSVAGTFRPTLIGIENIDVTVTEVVAKAVVLDLLNTDSTSLAVMRSTQSKSVLTFDNVGTATAEIQSVLTGAIGTTVNYMSSALAGAQDNVKIVLDNVTTGATYTLGRAAGQTTGVIETITLNSTIGATNAAKIVNSTDVAGAYTLAIQGAAGGTFESDAKTVQNTSTGAVTYSSTGAIGYTYAGSAKGADTLNIGKEAVTAITNTETIAIAASGSAIVADSTAATITLTDGATVVAGDGNDTINASGTAGKLDSINTGLGDNTVVFATATDLDGDGVGGANNDDTVTGGAGGSDQITVNAGNLTDAQFVGVTGFEVLNLGTTAGAILDTLAFAAGIRTINGAFETAAGKNNAANLVTLEEGDANLTLTINGGTGTGDQITVKDSNPASAGQFTLNVSGVETIDASAADVSGVTVTVGAADTTNVTFTGSAKADVFNGGLGDDTMTAGTGTDTVDGAAGNDTLKVETAGTVSVSGVETIDAAAGSKTTVTDSTAATITLTGGATVVAGGGDDTINASGTATKLDSINTGLGDNTVVFATAADLDGDGVGGAKADDTVTGGTGTKDAITVTAGGPLVDNQFVGVTGIEVLNLGTKVGATLDTLAFKAGIRDINGASETKAGGNDAGNLVTLEEGDANLTLTINGGTGTGDQITVKDSNAVSAGQFTLTVSGVETIDASDAAVSGVTVTVDAADTTDVTFTGSAKADVFYGSVGKDVITGGDGKDTLVGGGGDDIYVLTVAQFNVDQDVITEDSEGGNDTLRLTSAAAATIADTGFNGRFGNVENVEFVSTAGAAKVFTVDIGGYSSDSGQTIFSAGKDATLDITVNNYYTKDVTINGGANNDLVNYRSGAAVLEGFISSGDITFFETGTKTGADTVVTGAGDDTITLADGNNVVNTGSGDDLITLGADKDSVNAGADDDSIVGGNGGVANGFASNVDDNDTIDGGAGVDTLTLDGVTNLTNANKITGVETITLLSQGDAAANPGYQYSIVLAAASAIDGATALTIDGAALLADADTSSPALEAETLMVDASLATYSVSVTGGAANDLLTGSDQADTLNGGAGNDVLTGGKGDDNVTLGTGTDTVMLGATLALNGNDTITGFTTGDTDGVLTAGLGEGDLLELAGIVQLSLADGNPFTPVADPTHAGFFLATAANTTGDLTVATGGNVAYAVYGTTATLDLSNVKVGGTAQKGEILVVDDSNAFVLYANTLNQGSFLVYRVFDNSIAAAADGIVTAEVELLGTVTLTGSTFGDLLGGNVG